MKLNDDRVSLPYPVLGHGDDILPQLSQDSIQLELKVSDTHDYIITIKLNLNNRDIQALIDTGKAEFSCEYECPRTMLRRCKASKAPQFDITIPQRDVNGRIIFQCYVSVKSPIQDYINRGFNPDYGNASFDMEAGDILAAFPQCHYDTDIDYSKLQAAGSFMQIIKGDSDTQKEIFFDISSNKINIVLPPDYYELYTNPSVKNSLEELHSSLVLNALTYALLNISNYDGTLWARTIKYRIENEYGLSFDNLTEDASKIPGLAQRLLKEPYKRLFNHIINNRKEEIED